MRHIMAKQCSNCIIYARMFLVLRTGRLGLYLQDFNLHAVIGLGLNGLVARAADCRILDYRQYNIIAENVVI